MDASTPSSEAPLPDGPHWTRRHILGIEGWCAAEITAVLDMADRYVDQNRRADKRSRELAGLTIMNLFFEDSTRTKTSFELAGKRLGADVLSMSVATSSVKKGETLLDTAMTLNAMKPDFLVVRHAQSGAPKLLADKVNCSVINAGDGTHEHPTQALLDALSIRRRKGTLGGSHRRDLRRYPAQPRRAIEYPPAGHDGRAGPRRRPADPAALRRSTGWASMSSPTWRTG